MTEPDVIDVGWQGEAVCIKLHVPAGLHWFVGHFPATPLLPGLLQTAWAMQFGQRYFALPPQFCYLRNMKFMRLILPDTEIELRLRYLADQGELAFEYHDQAALCASGRMGFDAESHP